MADLRGADLEAMDNLSSKLRVKSQQLATLRTTSTGQIGRLNVLWDGPDSRSFVQRWNSQHGPALARAVQVLEDAADTITRNRQAQDETSATLLDGSGGGDGGGGGGFGFGSIGNFVGDAWDSAGDFASDAWDTAGDAAGDAWDWTSDTASDAWSWTTDAASDAWDWTSDTASDAWDWTSDTASDAWDAAAPIISEGGHRLGEFGEWGWARGKRRFTNPLQSLIDDFTLTGPLETIVGATAILGLGGEFEDSIGDGQFEAITGTSIAPNGAITLGHTVIFDSPTPSDGLIEHEQQHVYDIESVGGAKFYESYLGHWLFNIATGQDASLQGEAYENIIWEQRSDEVQHGPAEPEHLFFDLDPWSWFD